MATYRLHANGAFRLQERPIYGSSRVGLYAAQVDLYPAGQIVPLPQVIPVFDGLLRYELNDHLGNVGTVVTGRLLPGQGAPHEAEVISAQGYEPGGSLLPGRNYSSSSYDYGFNGMRKDDEIHGATGMSYDFGARLYDPRVGRWWSLDPHMGKYAPISPYVFALNNPIIFVDEDGNEVIGADGKPVTFTRTSSGQIEWSANATADVRILGNAMLETPTGAAQFKKMQDSRLKIMLVYDVETPASALRTDAGIKLGGTQHPWIDPDPTDPTADITMKPGGVTTVTVYGNAIEEAMSDGTIDGVSGVSYMGALGIVGSHEAEHAADGKNINLQQRNLMLKKWFGEDPELNLNEEVERVPEAVGRKAGQESVDMQPQRMTPRTSLNTTTPEKKPMSR